MSDIPIIELRRIEASIIRPIFEAMVEEFGAKEAERVLDRAVRNNAIEQAAALAAEGSEPTSLQSFVDLLERWKAGDALEIDVVEQSDSEFHFNVTRCRYAEMYRDMGLGDIGHLLSCNRDGAFCEGYDTKLKLERGQTIMSGAPHCDFRYRYED